VNPDRPTGHATDPRTHVITAVSKYRQRSGRVTRAKRRGRRLPAVQRRRSAIDKDCAKGLFVSPDKRRLPRIFLTSHRRKQDRANPSSGWNICATRAGVAGRSFHQFDAGLLGNRPARAPSQMVLNELPHVPRRGFRMILRVQPRLARIESRSAARHLGRSHTPARPIGDEPRPLSKR